MNRVLKLLLLVSAHLFILTLNAQIYDFDYQIRENRVRKMKSVEYLVKNGKTEDAAWVYQVLEFDTLGRRKQYWNLSTDSTILWHESFQYDTNGILMIGELCQGERPPSLGVQRAVYLSAYHLQRVNDSDALFLNSFGEREVTYDSINDLLTIHKPPVKRKGEYFFCVKFNSAGLLIETVSTYSKGDGPHEKRLYQYDSLSRVSRMFIYLYDMNKPVARFDYDYNVNGTLKQLRSYNGNDQLLAYLKMEYLYYED